MTGTPSRAQRLRRHDPLVRERLWGRKLTGRSSSKVPLWGAVAALRHGEKGVKTVVLERGLSWTISAANGNICCTYRKPDGPSSLHRELEWSLGGWTQQVRKALSHFLL